MEKESGQFDLLSKRYWIMDDDGDVDQRDDQTNYRG